MSVHNFSGVLLEQEESFLTQSRKRHVSNLRNLEDYKLQKRLQRYSKDLECVLSRIDDEVQEWKLSSQSGTVPGRKSKTCTACSTDISMLPRRCMPRMSVNMQLSVPVSKPKTFLNVSSSVPILRRSNSLNSIITGVVRTDSQKQSSFMGDAPLSNHQDPPSSHGSNVPKDNASYPRPIRPSTHSTTISNRSSIIKRQSSLLSDIASSAKYDHPLIEPTDMYQRSDSDTAPEDRFTRQSSYQTSMDTESSPKILGADPSPKGMTKVTPKSRLLQRRATVAYGQSGPASGVDNRNTGPSKISDNYNPRIPLLTHTLLRRRQSYPSGILSPVHIKSTRCEEINETGEI